MSSKQDLSNTLYNVLDYEKQAGYQNITSLKHDVLECCVCGSKERLIRVPELICEIWCIECAEQQTIDE